MELGRVDNLTHIVGHTADGTPAMTCPHCGSILAILHRTEDGDIIYCRACRSKVEHFNESSTSDRIVQKEDPSQGWVLFLLPGQSNVSVPE